jgi:SAM-dependent methyltransferase
MSRELLNNKYCVRCGKKDPTPYLKKYTYMFKEDPDWASKKVIDIGCGNGRNSEHMKSEGFRDVTSLDMKPDYGVAMTLGEDTMPVPDGSADIILANYVLMFLNHREFTQVMNEIERIAAPGAYLMYELYAAKDSHCKTKQALISCRDGIAARVGWDKIRYAQEHCILKKP